MSDLLETVPNLEVNLWIAHYELPLAEVCQGINNMLSPLPFHSLVALQVTHLDFTPTQWLDTFGNLERLKFIRVTGYQSGFLDALSIRTSVNWLQVASPIHSFVALQYLAILEWVFPDDVDPKQLTLALLGRQRSELPLQELHISGSAVTSAMVADLRELAGKVVYL